MRESARRVNDDATFYPSKSSGARPATLGGEPVSGVAFAVASSLASSWLLSNQQTPHNTTRFRSYRGGLRLLHDPADHHNYY